MYEKASSLYSKKKIHVNLEKSSTKIKTKTKTKIKQLPLRLSVFVGPKKSCGSTLMA